VGLQYRRPPRWQIPVVLAAAVVLLAVAGVFVALKTATDDAEKEVANGPASRTEARQATTPAKPKPATTTTTAAKPDSEKPAADPALAVAKRGPVAVLSGVPEPGAAKKFARRLEREGFTTGKVTNAPGGFGTFSVQYVAGSEDAARALAKTIGVTDVRKIDSMVTDRAGDAKLVVIVGARK
jgi:hypothetical protein